MGALALATFGLFILPDLAFHLAGYPTAAVRKPESLLLAALFAITISIAIPFRQRVLAIGAVLFSQLLWLGCIAYFGKALGPEQILLSASEAADITSGILYGWRPLLPAIALTLLTGGALLALHRIPVDRQGLGRLATIAMFWIALAGCTTYWVTHKRAAVLVPGAQTWSALGPYLAFIGATRIALSKVSPPPGVTIQDPVVKPLPMGDEPTTVVVIMGEGITPVRLSHFGHPEATSPRLDAWKTNPPAGFELISKIGFAGGVATLGSVPSFIKLSYWPVEGEIRGQNLFDLAKAQNFKTWYLSAQSRHFLEVAGGARNAELVFAEQGNVEQFAAKHDDVLLDLAHAIPQDGGRRFVFFHQRVNHSHYTNHCSHLPKEEKSAIYGGRAADGSSEARRRAAYDTGLRCWDRNAALLADAFTHHPGAVYIFITADHSEMMGEDGLWGHSMANLKVALVPVLLLTNRPDSDIAARFRAMNPPTGYDVARLVARALGSDIETPGNAQNRFFFNTTMPFGRSGYFDVDILSPDRFRMKRFSKEGKLLETSTVDLPNVKAANAGSAPIASQ